MNPRSASLPVSRRISALCKSRRRSRRGSGEICVNGAAAHLIQPHDVVIICSYVQLDDAECRGFEGIRVFVDRHNRAREILGPSPVLARE